LVDAGGAGTAAIAGIEQCAEDQRENGAGAKRMGGVARKA
jgi:hypothetical protein